MDYYNEFDPKAAAWLRELIKIGLIPEGDVDERSIEDIVPRDLVGYRRHHFFAGIGGWAYALALAGWPDDLPIWTGSCPCQPFSSAGKSAGFNDERHLWPAWQHLIAQYRPAIVVGEQVASKAVAAWIDLVFDDLEAMGYSCGAIAHTAAGNGAPHLRDRTYWVADAAGGRRNLEVFAMVRSQDENSQREASRPRVREPWGDAVRLEGRDGYSRLAEPSTLPLAHGVPARMVRLRGYGNAIVPQQAAEFLSAWLTP